MYRTDKNIINFSETHELNYVLRFLQKKTSTGNYRALQKLGRECKAHLGRRSSQTLAHKEFYDYLLQSGSLNRLE